MPPSTASSPGGTSPGVESRWFLTGFGPEPRFDEVAEAIAGA
jgi:hypothetical protein